MLSSKDVPSIVTVKKTTANKSLAAKIFGLAAHIGILAAGTKVAEYAWRFWGACQSSRLQKFGLAYRTLDGTNGSETT